MIRFVSGNIIKLIKQIDESKYKELMELENQIKKLLDNPNSDLSEIEKLNDKEWKIIDTI